MDKNTEELLDLIKNKFQEKSYLKKSNHDFDDFYLSFRSSGPVKKLKDEDAPVPSYWIVTPQSNPHKVILFFHGGGFNRGTSRGHLDICKNLAKHSSFTILSVDYRMSPENPFPAAVEDCLNSFLWLLDEGFTSQDILVAGISYGGTLALSTTLALKKRSLIPRGVVCMSPAVDMGFPVVYKHLKDVRDWIDYEQLSKIREMYLQGQEIKNPMISPIYGDLEGFPPLLLQTGGLELLLCDTMRFRDLAIQKEVQVKLDVWQGMFHGFQIFYSVLPQAKAAISSIGNFVKKLQLPDEKL
ncbi:MAG: alpha/beta hydrolase [Methanobacterium sp.]|nr:alpha/beta hydrolase [Methanobacterium sp.]